MEEVLEKEVAVVAPKEVGSVALITLDPAKYAAEVFLPFRTKLDQLIADSAAVEFDITTTAGMATAVKWRAAFRDEIRIAADKTRKARKEPITLIGKLLESEYKSVEDAAGPYESKYDDAIKVEEARKDAEKQAKIAAERQRIERITTRINAMVRAPLSVVGQSSVAIDRAIQILLNDMPDESFDEFLPEAQEAHATALATMQTAVAAAIQSEQEAAQAIVERERVAAAQAAEHERLASERATLERQRAEFAEKIEEQERVAAAARKLADEAAAEARRAADAEAAEVRRKEADSLVAQQAELKRQQDEIDERNRVAAAAEQVRLDAIHEEQKALARAERAEADRISQAAAQKAIADEADRVRKADETHRLNIHDEIAEALDGAGVDSDLIPEIIQLIRAGKIPHVSISY